jgi:hypothetical protein
MSHIRAHGPQDTPTTTGRTARPRDGVITRPENQWADFQAARERFFAVLRGEASAVVGVRRPGAGEGP